MNTFFLFLRITFSVSGPIIVSFGTYSGLLTFIAIFFGHQNTSPGTVTSYSAYLLFLYLTGILLEKKSFDQKISRKQDSAKTDPGQTQGIQYTLIDLLSGGYSQLVNWVLEIDGVTFYDVFKRPPYWEKFDGGHKEYPIFRLEIRGESIEVRYPKGKSGKILLRTTPGDSQKFGEWQEKDLKNLKYWKTLAVFAPWEYFKQRFFACKN